jgi:hypothetical protein
MWWSTSPIEEVLIKRISVITRAGLDGGRVPE